MNKINEVSDKNGIKQTWLAAQTGQQLRLKILNGIANILKIDIKELL